MKEEEDMPDFGTPFSGLAKERETDRKRIDPIHSFYGFS